MAITTKYDRILGDLRESDSTTITATQDETFPISHLSYTVNGVEVPITEIPKADGLFAGGGVNWIENFDFGVDAAAYYLNGILYTTLATTITLDAADATNPRLDIIIVDNTETVSFIKGTPAANPQKPTVDPETQVELTTILVPAGATEPEDLTTEQIYDENIEWTGSSSGVTVDFDSVTAPFHDTKCTDVGTIENNDTVTYTNGADVDRTDYENLVLYIKLKAVMTSQHNIYLSFLESTVAVSNEYKLALDKNNITGWQSITIPLSSWAFTQSNIDALKFRWSKTGALTTHAGFYLDFIKLAAGIVPPIYTTFNLVDDLSPQLGGNLDVNGRSIDWGAIITTNGTYKGETLTVTVDTNSIGFGCLLAQGADFHFDEADASSIDTSAMLVMALEAGTGSKKVLLKGQICNTSWNWVRGAIFASETLGELTQDDPPVTAEDAVVVVAGWALSADTMYFNPYNAWATRYEEVTTTTTEVGTTTTTTV